MRIIMLCLALFMPVQQDVVSYIVTERNEIISERYRYSFKVPEMWSISHASRVPYLFTFAASRLVSQGVRVGVPRGGAEISIVADEESHQAGSIERWVEIDRAKDGFVSTHELQLSSATTIKRAVIADSFHDDGDSRRKQITRTTAIYFEFQGHVLAAFLSYNENDPKSKRYHAALMKVVESFRPLRS